MLVLANDILCPLSMVTVVPLDKLMASHGESWLMLVTNGLFSGFNG